ncbi:hypothetical protein QL285_063190 [Trifolium repens]|nr:hypothetical protein QL285_063146 [Trifolium repens]KAK2389611.1 hypothetical protein QL285_063190 [Trifolium repens]
MVVGVPNWDIFKGPREITKSKRKPKPTEQEIVEEGSQEQSGNRNDVAEETEQVNSGAERLATEENEGITEEQLASIAQRKAVQKERRSKKRLDRPTDAEEDQNVRAAKKKKTVVAKKKAADTSKGNSSKSNTDSIFTAQSSTAQPSKQPSPIDFTKPLNVVLPNPQPSSSSSSSEETLSDSSIDSTELIAKLDRIEKEKAKKKKPVKKTFTKRTIKKPIHISSDERRYSN